MESERNDFADIIRMTATNFGVLDDTEDWAGAASTVLATAMMAVYALHPDSEWSFLDITDEVRAEAPHLSIPDDIKLFFRELRISVEVMEEIHQGCLRLGMGEMDDVTLASYNKLLERARAKPDGRVTVNAMVSTKYGLSMTAPGEDGWQPTPSERAVFDHAISVVSLRHSTIDGNVVERNGRGGWSRRLSTSVIDGLVTEASEVLADDAKVTGVVDAWANYYKDEGG